MPKNEKKLKIVTLQQAATMVPQAPQVVPFDFEIPEGLIPVNDVEFDTMNHVIELREKAKEAYKFLKLEQERLAMVRNELEKVAPQANADYSFAKAKTMAAPGMAYLKVLLTTDNVTRKTERYGWEEKIKTELARQNKNYSKFLELKHEIAVTQQWVDANAGRWMDMYTQAKEECNEYASAANKEHLRYEVQWPQKKKLATA